jgi:two-component system phosphate regulon response regulator OmpR
MTRQDSTSSSSASEPRNAEGPVAPDSILIVDDDRQLRETVAQYLIEEGFRVSQTDGRRGAQAILAGGQIDLVLLDLMLGHERGLDLLTEVRRQSPNIGLIIMTGRSDVIDRVIGLEFGADDYITKPFELRELAARVRSLLRRVRRTGARPSEYMAEDVIQFEGWRLDLVRRRLTDPSGSDVVLTTGEFTLLAIFAKRPGYVLDRDRLLDLSKGRGWNGFDRTIDAHVAHLRKKIEPDPSNPTFIKSVRGVGYVFAARVEQ